MFIVKDISASLCINRESSNYHQAECKMKLINHKEERETLMINIDFENCKKERLNNRLDYNKNQLQII